MTHELKILPRWFKDVAQGLKNFEIRKNDRNYKVGDILILKEWDGEHYTGAFVERRVGYVYYGNGEYGVEEGYCILGLYPYNGKLKTVGEWLDAQSCEDAISRKEALEELRNSTYSKDFCIEHHIDWSISLEMVELTINRLSSVTPIPKDDVLDKIKAEITEEITPITIDGLKVRSGCLRIIDRYKDKGVEE